MDSNQRPFAQWSPGALGAGPGLPFGPTNSSRFMLRMTAHRADASLVCPVDVFTSPAIIDSKSNCDQYKNQDHRKGDPDFCVVTVGLEPTVSLRSVKFAIGVQPPWSGVCTCCSLRFRLALSRTAGARLRAPLDVFTSQMIIGSEPRCDHTKIRTATRAVLIFVW